MAVIGAALGAGAGGAIGSAIGGLANGGDADEVKKIQEELYARSLGLTVPQLQRLQAEQISSEYNNIHLDPSTRSAQMEALSRMRAISNQGGLDPTARAQLEEGRQAASGMAAGGRAALMGRMASRGALGSGAEWAASAGNDQAAAQRLSQSGYQAAAGAQQRGLDALRSTNEIGSGIRNADFGEASARAQAADAINRFNAQNRTDVNRYNALLPQQEFANKAALYNLQSGAASDYAAGVQADMKKRSEVATGIGTAIGGVAGAIIPV